MAQLNSLLVTGNSRFLNPINGNARNGIYYVKGTQTASTGSWTGNIPVPALYDGLTIMYYLPYAGSGNATLNLTLLDGTTTGAVNCYYRKNERLTTHYGSGYNFAMVYHPAGAITIDGTATSDNRWIVESSYADGNDQSYNERNYYVRATAGSNKVLPYTLVMRLSDGRWESIVTSSTSAATKSRNTHGFLFGQLTYNNYNETFNENALISDARLYIRYTYLVDYRNSFNISSSTGFTANKPIYLVGSISSDGLFYLDTTWWTQTLPSTADGKIYLYIGDAYDWYRASFFGTSCFKAYVYTNGHIREYNQDAATVGGHTVAKDVPSNAVFTDNNTTYSMTRDGESVKLTPSSGSAQSISLSSLINGLGEGSSPAQQDDYLVAQYAGGGTTTTSYHRRAVKNIVNAANVKTALGTGSGTTKYLREDGTWQTPPSGSDVNVTQTATSTSADYEVLFSATADNTTRTETARKNSNLKFNPSSGNLQATQLNGVTIGSSPKFTDNNTTYTFANGTNGFTVTPSGGSAQTVTVTPSITNNVTGSGTSGYLTKFNGANTITNGPQLGSDTTKFLRNDGSWAVPPTASGGNKIFTVQPTPPYSVGDLYLESENDISVCTVARASGSYDSDDWGSAVDAVNSELLDSAIKSAISSTLTVVTGAGTEGGTVMWRLNPETNVPYELLVTDTPTNITSNTAKIYRFDANGLRYSASGYEGSYISLINSSGRIPAEYLTGTLNAANFSAVQNFTATMINGGKLVRGYTNNSKGTIELQDASGTVIAEVGNYGFKFYGQGSGDDRPYYIINTNGFIGYTKVSGTWTQTIKVAFDEFRMVKGYVSEEFNIGGKIKIVPQTTSTNDGIAFVAST